MDADQFFLGQSRKIVKTKNISNDDSGENHGLKCKADEIEQLLSEKKLEFQQLRYERRMALSEGEWDENLKVAKVTKVGKNLTKNFSHSRNKSIYLYPEECLCLLEMKMLLLKWNGRILSIKNAYALLLAEGSGCTFKQFRTFSYLVKLGFRVFRHNSELKNNINDNEINNLTKLPETSTKRKSYNIKTDHKSYSNDKVSFSGIVSTGWVTLSRPPQCYTPYNIQPDYDTYSFNITVSSDTLKITEVISFYETLDFKKMPFYPKPTIIYGSQPTGMYPVYEKITPKTKKSDEDIMYEPHVKKSKYSEIEKDGLSININIKSSSSNDASQSQVSNKDIYPMNKAQNALNHEESIIIDEGNLFTSTDVIDSTLSDENASMDISFTNEVLLNLKIKDDQQFNENSKKKSIANVNVDNLPEDELCGMKLKLPNHIRQKLFAIKPKNESNELINNTNNEHNVQFDVYYPDNYVPKTLRSVPDYRIIIFDNDSDSFPNIYDVNKSNPDDNVPTLWAIVNSSSVSFYNVNNIILPKSTDWKNWKKNKESF